MAPRATVTPIALAVLALLREGPMHPYRMAHELRVRGQADSVRLSPGSLYYAVQTLERRGLIAEQGTQRTGRQPERTVYVSTDAGQQELRRSLAGVLRAVSTNLAPFAGALGWLQLLDLPEALDALRTRADELQKLVTETRVGAGPAQPALDARYRLHMLRAEQAWVAELVRHLEGTCQELGLADPYSSTRVLPWS